MPKKNIKNIIDDVRDTIVGKIPMPNSQVEQITIALLYKFMDDMDQESIDLGGNASFFSGDYAKYSWKRIMSDSIGSQTRYNLYTEALEKFYLHPTLPSTFREIFKNVSVPYKDAETLTNFLKIINDEFDYSNSEILGDAYEYLLSILGSQGDLGQFRTPRHLIDFIVELVNPTKDDTILDPACGTAGFLISAYKHILKSNSDNSEGDKLSFEERKEILKNINGYDIEPSMVRIAEMNLFLHGASDPEIHEYDTLTMEDRWEDKFSCILANPPFMTPTGGIKPHNRFDISANRAEALFVDYIVNHITSKGKAGIIIPDTILFSTSAAAYKQLRKILIENGLYCIVSLPAGVFKPYAKDVKTSILLLNKQYSTDKIYHITTTADGYTLTDTRRPTKKNDLPEAKEVVKNIIKVLTNEIEELPSSNLKVDEIPISEMEKHDYSLLPNKYKERVRLNTKYQYKEIGKYICENKEKAGKNSYPVWSVSNKLGFVKTEEYHSEQVASSDTKNYKVIKKGYFAYNPSRVNVGSIALNDSDIVSCVSPMYVSFYVNSEELDEKYLLYLIKSSEFKNIIDDESYGAVRKQLRIDDMKKIRIPVPTIDEQKKYVEEIEKHQKKIDSLNEEINQTEKQINSIFSEIIN